MNEIVEIISTVGFPIAVAVYMLYRESTVIKQMSDALSNNTTVLEKLLTKLDMDEGN